MKRIKHVLLILLLMLPTVAVPAQNNPNVASTLVLEAGHTRLLSVPDVTRVAIGNGDIANVEVIESTEEILLIGRNTGDTDLRIWKPHGSEHRRIRVVTSNASDIETSLASLFQAIDGVEIQRVNGQWIALGRPQSTAAAHRLNAALEAFPDIRDLTDNASVLPEATIQVQARFVELRRSALRQIGINWSSQSPGITFAYASDFYTNDVFRGGFGDFLPADALPLDIGEGNQYLGLGLNLTSMIDLLGESGEARVIAEPMLSTLSGSAAEFQAGGEVPIPVQGEDGSPSVTFKDYGILLKVAPVMGDNGLIRTQIEVEVSDVDESVSVLGVPGFSVRNASTEMNAESGETLLIAGLIDEQQSEAVSQIPGLGDLPVIGELFKSRRFQQDQTELVVLITPTAKDSAVQARDTSTFEEPRTQLPPAIGLDSNALPLKGGWN